MQNAPCRLTWQTYLSIFAAIVAVATAIYTMAAPSRHDAAGIIGFIDFQAVLRESKAGRDLNAQVAPKQKALQEDAQAKFEELKQRQDALNKRRGSMPASEFDEKNKALQQAVADWNAEAQKREAALNATAAEVVKTIQQLLRDQLPALAERNNITAILPADQLFYAQKKLDVTPEVIRLLDDKLPKADIRFDEKK